MQTSNILLIVFCTVGGVVIIVLIGVLVVRGRQRIEPTYAPSNSRTSRTTSSRYCSHDQEASIGSGIPLSEISEYDLSHLRRPARAHYDVYRVRGVSDRELDDLLENGPCDGHHTIIKIKRQRQR